MNDIEPNIRPLVDALNQTGIVRTFSSCEGHFRPDEQTLVDRNHAEVRFVPVDGASPEQVEKRMAQILARFKRQHGLLPVKTIGYKLYTPIDDEAVEETFVLELQPFNRFDSPDRKRADVNRAIQQLVTVVQNVLT